MWTSRGAACAYLVADDVLLVAQVKAQHSEAVRTQQVFSVSVSGPKVKTDVAVEGRAELAHLQAESTAQQVHETLTEGKEAAVSGTR